MFDPIWWQCLCQAKRFEEVDDEESYEQFRQRERKMNYGVSCGSDKQRTDYILYVQVKKRAKVDLPFWLAHTIFLTYAILLFCLTW